jgi:hypothetical protein
MAELFLEKIRDRLKGRVLNPQDFEDCMNQLLRKIFPGLFPVRGGTDAGMDGAIADGEGEAFPLVVTTAKDVERNLTKNLDSYLRGGEPRRKVVLATSQALTPPRQKKLKKLARSKGVTLVQIIEQSGVAILLLENADWCEKLLDLTAEPSTLSVVPASQRPQVEVEPIGRDADIQWLKSTKGDRVLSGAPGSGKTFLLYHLTRQGWGVFVANPEGPVAKDLQNQRPEIVIVDDAHVEPEFLAKLRYLRQESKLDFSIIATTWEGGKDQVIEALGVGETQVHKLEPLTRDELVDLYHRLGVDEDPETMHYLVDQAATMPGLAATIATLWLQGSWREVIEGKALSRTLLTFFDQFVGRESTDVLAAFSLGGDRGLELEVVREYLGFTRPQLRQITAGLAAGGVLSEVGKDFLAVWPKPLRAPLIRAVFFPDSGAGSDYRGLIDSAPHLGKAVKALIEARALGAAIPNQELWDLVMRSESLSAWKALAQLSEVEARWVLENYTEDFLDIASALLHLIPREVIPRILERAAEPNKKMAGWSQPHQPMSILSGWVEDIRARPEEWLDRRRMLAAAAKKHLLDGRERSIGIHAFCISLSPNLHGASLDPGKGNVLSMSRGLLPSETLRQLELVWDEVKGVIQEIDAPSCSHLIHLLRDWYHQYSAGSARDAAAKRDLMRGFARRVLGDQAIHSQGSPGLRSAFERLASEFEISLGLEQDPTLLLLYNYEPGLSSWSENEAAKEPRLKVLATDWAQLEPSVGVQKIAYYEKEAKKGIGDFRYMPDFCSALADVVQEPEAWLDEALSEDLQGDLLVPFLRRIVRDRREGWESRLIRSLDIESLKWGAATLVLKEQDPPDSLLQKAFEFSELTTLVKERSQNQSIPISTVKRLLLHSRWEIARAAAVGEWWAEPLGDVREEILPEWRSAILRSKTEEYPDTEPDSGLQYSLGCILSRDGDLALEWLRSRLCNPDLPRHFLGDSPFAHALRALRKGQRIALLQELKPVQIMGDMLPLLIGEDIEVYRQVLTLPGLSKYHLAPLGGLPQKPWSDLALAALQAGYEPAQIAEAAFEETDAVVGSGIEYWEKWDLAFAEIEREGPLELQEVSRYGRKMAQERLQGAKVLERSIGIHGLVGGLIPRNRDD